MKDIFAASKAMVASVRNILVKMRQNISESQFDIKGCFDRLIKIEVSPSEGSG